MPTARRVARRARANLRARWLAAAVVLGCALALLGLPGARGVEAAAAPTITSGSPSIGAMGGGTVVTLTGTGFVAGATVTFAGVAAPVVTVVSATQIDATTPAVAPGAAVITVTNPDTQSGTLAGAFTFLAAPPAITLIAPANGSSLGGTAVTVTGTDFVAGATVTIGGTAATSVLVVAVTALVAATGHVLKFIQMGGETIETVLSLGSSPCPASYWAGNSVRPWEVGFPKTLWRGCRESFCAVSTLMLGDATLA